MSKHKEWDEFLESLFCEAFEEYQDTKKYEISREKLNPLNVRLVKEYPEEKNALVYEYIFENGLHAEHKNEFLYLQGLKDCVFLLKKLGIIA